MFNCVDAADFGTSLLMYFCTLGWPSLSSVDENLHLTLHRVGVMCAFSC